MNYGDLIKQYPKLYGENFFFETPDDWLPVIAKLSAQLDELLPECGVPWAGQVKEKFGGLRYYLDGNHSLLDEETYESVYFWIREAEKEIGGI